MFQRIGRNHSLHSQVMEHIRKCIEEGKLGPGDRLPTEQKMSEQFAVSRTVIRDAVKRMTGLGILEVKKGIGIFCIYTRYQVYGPAAFQPSFLYY